MTARTLWWLALAALAAALGGVALGLVVIKRVETGRWGMLDEADLGRVRDRITTAAPRPSRVIYLARTPLTLRPGPDDAAAGRSSVLAAHAGREVRLPGWKGSARAWTRTVACVRDRFAPFDVEITERRPPGDDFVLVAVGGRPRNVGARDPRLGGLAPFSGAVIPRAVVFAFAAELDHRPPSVCETIAAQVARAYGLDSLRGLQAVLGPRRDGGQQARR
ncbi:MAG TPA: hypothetical protein VM734_19825 [Kofleriaceae bacterium]|nr:hypothetical protein [Kofleriaceae bacterium]